MCAGCGLAQLRHTVAPDALFGDDYFYFSSYTQTVLDNAGANVEAALARFRPGPDALVVELASNDGYLLKQVAARGFRVLGIDPAPHPVEAARAAGDRDDPRLLHRGARRRAGGRGAAGVAALRQQRAGARRRHAGLRARHPPPAPAGRHRHHRGALPARPDRPPRIRHDLPRAPLLLLGHGAARAVRPPGAAPERRGAHPHPRRLAAASSCRSGTRRASACSRCCGRSARAGSTGRTPSGPSRRASRRSGEELREPARPAQGRGQARRGLRRGGEGHDPAQPFPHRRREPALDRRQEPAQARPATCRG